MRNITNLELKAQILSNGINITEEAIKNFSEPYLIKRRAYGNSDDDEFLIHSVPQELILLPDDLIVGVTLRSESEWILDYADNKFLIKNQDYNITYVNFTEKPSFYDVNLSNGKSVCSIATLLSRNILGLFVNTSCTFAKPGLQCKYCSINKNSGRPKDLLDVIDKNLATEAVDIALKTNPNLIKTILISGGNFIDFNNNFIYYTDLAIAINNVAKKYSKKIQVVLNVFPPEDFSLIERLKDTELNILISTEVFDKDLFKKYCPGKDSIVGKEHIVSALDKLVNVLGVNRVYSIVIHGLEPDNSLISGMEFYGSKGICPIVNVLHIDTNTEMKGTTLPTSESILSIGKKTQELYSKYGFNTLNIYSGRNSFDREASLKIFKI